MKFYGSLVLVLLFCFQAVADESPEVLTRYPDGTIQFVPLEDLIDGTGDPGTVDPEDSPFVPEGYVRTFTEEFDDDMFPVGDAYTAAQGTKWIDAWHAWRIRNLEGNSDDGGKLSNSKTHVLENGVLSLRAVKDSFSTVSGGRQVFFPYRAGMISTEVGFSQRFGYAEVRAQMILSKGHHAAIWLLHDDNTYNTRREVAEVDFVENVNGEGTLYFNHHGPGVEPITKVQANPADWHVYGLLWEQDRMVWYLDGKEVRRSSRSMPREAYFIASLEIASSWPGDPDDTTRWPAELNLDYVRFYQREQ